LAFFRDRGRFPRAESEVEPQGIAALSRQLNVAVALHLIQNCMVYINTLMIQKVLAQPHWHGRLTPARLRRADHADMGV
jgi:Tn3 transposase DDE domain